MSRVRIVVGSRNPAKVEAVREAVSSLFPGAVVDAIAADSGVASQPRSDEEAIEGAVARARAALAALPVDSTAAPGAAARYGVGVESGVARVGGHLFGCTWVAVAAPAGRLGLGASARFQLPPAVAAALDEGEEMGAVMGRISGDSRIHQKDGAMGVVSAGHVTRRSAAVQAVHFAFGPFLVPELYGRA